MMFAVTVVLGLPRLRAIKEAYNRDLAQAQSESIKAAKIETAPSVALSYTKSFIRLPTSNNANLDTIYFTIT